MDVEFPENRGTPERRAEGARGVHLLADWARPEAERAEVSSAVHQEDMVKTLCVSRLGVRAQGKVTLTEGAAFFSTFGLGEKARNLEFDLEFDLSVKLPNTFTDVWSCDQI